MSAMCRFCGSTIGKKIIVAITGLILVGFLLGHVAGNLLFFAGPAAMDAYSKTLHDNQALLWAVRVLLLVSAVVHIVVTLQLAKLRGDARPVDYQGGKSWVSNYATRSMILSGPFIAFFVVYHILHLTTGHFHPDPYKMETVYNNVKVSFSRISIAGVYVIAMILLFGHLVHGIWSMTQTIGLNHPKYDCWVKKGTVALAILITLGFISIPLFVVFGGGRA